MRVCVIGDERRGQINHLSRYVSMTVQCADYRDLLALLEEADRTGRQLYVSAGRPWLGRRNFAELLEMVEREDLFEPVNTLYGFEPRGLIHVYRYRGR